jgi:hypothetical protein
MEMKSRYAWTLKDVTRSWGAAFDSFLAENFDVLRSSVHDLVASDAH